jgi:RNA 2',3'-cyclic 3'-phosphodiesterase
MHRLFVAVDLPEQVKDSISAVCTGLPGAKWVTMNQLHLTLRFIGEVETDLFNTIRKTLGRTEESSFRLTLRGVGCFPSRKAPRVIWVGIDKNAALIRLADKIEQCLVENGLEPEQRSFSPHITIARLKEISPHKAADYLDKNSLFNTDAFPVEEFYLYSSTLTPQGAVHRKEATYPLRGGLEVHD